MTNRIDSNSTDYTSHTWLPPTAINPCLGNINITNSTTLVMLSLSDTFIVWLFCFNLVIFNLFF